MSSHVLVLGDGRYRAEHLLGRGHFGEVYYGTDTYLDRSVAIKLFEEDVDFDTVVLEAQVQGRLSHRHVVTLRDVVLDPPRPFTVMDYCPAGSVEDRLEAGAVTLTEAIRWTKDALTGLGEAHRENIIHRDIKPANWLLIENGHVAISDFGIAEDTFRQLRVDDQIYWRHMAPELLDGDSSPASDVWATACTLYRLLTGEYAFDDISQTLAGEYAPPHHLNRQVPLSLTRVIAKALALDPGDRYTNARDMFGALNACQIAHSWTPVDDPAALETWEAATPDGAYRIQLIDRPRAGLLLRATKDRGSGAGHRQVRAQHVASLARGRQILRGWLVDVVEGRSL